MKRKRIRMLTMVLLAAFSVTLILPLVSNAAAVVDLSQKCSLTVHAVNESSEYAEDLKGAAIVYDLYKVAGLEENVNYDGYFYRIEGIYQKISPQYTEKLTIQANTKDITAEDWEALAEEAMCYALFGMSREMYFTPGSQPVEGDNCKVLPQDTSTYNGYEIDKKLENLDAGLYLLIARDESLKNAESYTTTITDEQNADHVVSVAYTKKKGYYFSPALIAIPTKDEYEDEINSANPGEWVYDAVAYLKPAEIPYGNLRIIKNLPVFENSDEAIFVFDVKAVNKNGRVVYSDVVSINFTAPGTQKVVIEKLPVDAKVTVTEIYSGATYAPDLRNPSTWIIPGPGGEDNPGIITSNETITIEFNNIYDGRRTGGHGITNHFYYDFGNYGGWVVDQEMTSFDSEQNPNATPRPINPGNAGNQGNAGDQGNNGDQGNTGAQESPSPEPPVDQGSDASESVE